MKVFFQRLRNLLRRLTLQDVEFLCDTCKYDYGDACDLPQRPNAVVCENYARR